MRSGFCSAFYNHFQFFWKILKLKQILNFLKNGPWPYFRDNSYEIYYISLIEFSWVWAWSPNFNFFSNKKRGVSSFKSFIKCFIVQTTKILSQIIDSIKFCPQISGSKWKIFTPERSSLDIEAIFLESMYETHLLMRP